MGHQGSCPGRPGAGERGSRGGTRANERTNENKGSRGPGELPWDALGSCPGRPKFRGRRRKQAQRCRRSELATLQQRDQKLRERCAELADQELQLRKEMGGLVVKLMHSHTESVHAQLRELDSRGLNASIQPRTYTIEDSSGTPPLGDWRRLFQAMVVLSRERTPTVGDYSDYDCMEMEGGTPPQSGTLFGLFPRAPETAHRTTG